MKLYITPGGQWAGTEKDWKANLKSEGIDAKTYTGRKQIDIPTDKAGLMEFLTFHNVNVINPGTVQAVEPNVVEAALPVDVEALRALHNPEASPTPVPAAPTTVTDIDTLFVAAPIPKQVELAVGLLDRLESLAR